MTRTAGYVIAAALAGCTGSSDLPDPETYQVKGRLDAPAIKDPYTMIVDGDVVYVAHMMGVVVVQLDGDTPREIGRADIAPLGPPVYKLFRNGTYLYAGHDEKLTVIDIATPSAPMELGTLAGGFQGIGDMGLVGDVLVVGGGTGLRFLDATDPAAPADTAIYESSRGGAVTMIVDGTFGYLEVAGADGVSALVVMDLSDPLVGDHEVLSEVPNISGPLVQVGQRVYSANRGIVDVHDPYAARNAYTSRGTAAARAIAAHDGAIVLSRDADVPNGIRPALLFLGPDDFADLGDVELPTSGGAVALASHGDQILVLTREGLLVLAP